MAGNIDTHAFLPQYKERRRRAKANCLIRRPGNQITKRAAARMGSLRSIVPLRLSEARPPGLDACNSHLIYHHRTKQDQAQNPSRNSSAEKTEAQPHRRLHSDDPEALNHPSVIHPDLGRVAEKPAKDIFLKDPIKPGYP